MSTTHPLLERRNIPKCNFFLSSLTICHSLSSIVPASNTRVIAEPLPPVVYEGARIVLKCNVTRGSHLSYTWFFNRKKVTSSTSPLFNLTGNELVMEQATPEHGGHYSCMAWSTVQDNTRFSSSSQVKVTVKGTYLQKY